MTNKKRIAILGCGGSIGRQTIDVIQSHNELFELTAVTTRSNTDILAGILNTHRPSFVGIANPNAKIPASLAYNELYVGEDCNTIAAMRSDVDIVVMAINGIAALKPLLAAIRANKRIALANKESIVCGGVIVQDALKQSNATLLPVDSEQSAIFQCLHALSNRNQVSRLILTASGGPFLHFSNNELQRVTPEMALQHPVWSMGTKITIDSSTLANKGLEIIEAHYLFDMPREKLAVAVHPQSIVHSFVETIDGSMLAQLAKPDMRLPIQYALTYPDRTYSPVTSLDFQNMAHLEFMEPDVIRFSALALAYEALDLSGTAPAIYDTANTKAVSLFLQHKIGFTEIPQVIEWALSSIESIKNPDLTQLFSTIKEVEERICFKYKE